jgi:hypothetical protein
MQWESSGVYVWFFPRGSIPSDIKNGAPVTGNWETPIVAFNGGSSCNIDSFFANENIVFDTTFCGDVSHPLRDYPYLKTAIADLASGPVPSGEAALAPAWRALARPTWGLILVLLLQLIGLSTPSRSIINKQLRAEERGSVVTDGTRQRMRNLHSFALFTYFTRL